MKFKKVKRNEILKSLAIDLYLLAGRYSYCLTRQEVNLKLASDKEEFYNICKTRKVLHNALFDSFAIFTRNYRKIVGEVCPLLKEADIASRESVGEWAVHSSYKLALKRLRGG